MNFIGQRKEGRPPREQQFKLLNDTADNLHLPLMDIQPDKAAVMALLDIYSQAITVLQHLIEDISLEDLVKVADPLTLNPDCRSIQSVLTHVISSGYSYAIYIKSIKNIWEERPARAWKQTAAEYQEELNLMMAFTRSTSAAITDEDLNMAGGTATVQTSWGKIYDMEQLMEHAIVHILRHSRQVAKFKQILNSDPAALAATSCLADPTQGANV